MLYQLANQGDIEAMHQLALVYYSGEGTLPDRERFFYWTTRAAEAGHPVAMQNLALAYKDGIGTEPDFTQFIVWTHEAAEAGIPDAQYNLALYLDCVTAQAPAPFVSQTQPERPISREQHDNGPPDTSDHLRYRN
jgi:TPR repeat protein